MTARSGATAHAALMTPVPSPEYDDLRKRLENAGVKLAAQQLGKTSAGGGVAALPEALMQQAKMFEPRDNRSSTMKVEPRGLWSKLGDDGIGGREVEEFPREAGTRL